MNQLACELHGVLSCVTTCRPNEGKKALLHFAHALVSNGDGTGTDALGNRSHGDS
jgi:hypothetical protein